MMDCLAAPQRLMGITCLFLLCSVQARADEASNYDCGTLALYTMLRLEGTSHRT